MRGLWRSRGAVFAASVTAILAFAPPARAQSAENVVVVINENSPDSQRIGEYYARKREIPATNIIRIRTVITENVDRTVFALTVDLPIGAALMRNGLLDRVLYVVLTKGVPIRIDGTGGRDGTMASVDSELTLLYRRMTGQGAPLPGRIDNPYYLGSRPLAEAKPFTHHDYDIFLVTRLDGFTVDDVLALIDRGLMPAKEGRIVLDQQNKLVDRTGEDWLQEAAARLKAQGFEDRVLLEPTVNGVRDVRPVLGYYSWGSNDPRNRTRRFNLGFVPGSIAGMFVSSDARTFKEPPAEWVPTGDTDRLKWFAGTPQSLIGDLIREGVTGVSGHVAEPFLQSTVRPEILFPAYMAGSNLVEAFYLAMPHLSWQNVVVGDPLCAPFRRRTLARADIEDGVDPATGFPKSFSTRRMARLRAGTPGVDDTVLALLARTEALNARDDRAGVRSALEEATRLAPNLAGAHLQLAMHYERDQNYSAAVDRYRRVIELDPRNPVALNNLAYSLATRQNSPAEARPLAERAVAVAPQNPAFLDTLAWIEHLLGDNATAAKRIAAAVSAAPTAADLRLHAAAIYAATGARNLAEAELQAALKLNPTLEKSDDVSRVRAMLEKLPAAGAR
jgi:uncharacterized protein (TIGR03790 family)